MKWDMTYAPLHERFWRHVVRGDDPDKCWDWTASRHQWGYGQLGDERGGDRSRTKSYKIVRAHRVSWEIHNGPIPEGLCVLHTCDNPPCTNPTHLFLGTQKDNTRDKERKGRGRHTEQGRTLSALFARMPRHWNAKLTPDEVAEIRLRVECGEMRKDVAVHFNVSPATVTLIMQRRTWKQTP